MDPEFLNTASLESRVNSRRGATEGRGTPPPTEDPYVLSQRRKLRTILEDLQEIQEAGTNASLDKTALPVFQGMYETASGLFNKFSSLYDELTDLQGFVEPLETDRELRQRAKGLYYGICTYVKTLRADQPSGSLVASTMLESATTSGRTEAKLPPIQVPIFNGDTVHWPKFKDTFESMVLNEPKYSNIDRFHYLVHALKGPAAAIIASVTFSASDFPVAWQALLEEYDNPRLLATAYLDKLLNMTASTTKPTIAQLRQVTNELTEWVASFNKVNINDKADFLTFYLIRRVLDPHTRETFELNRDKSQFPTCKDLLKFLRETLTAKELAVGVPSPMTAGNVKTANQRTRANIRFATDYKTSLVAAPSIKPQRSSASGNAKHFNQQSSPRGAAFSPCPICGLQHYLFNCSTFNAMSAEQRFKQLSTWNGCKNCLYASHQTNKCISRLRCRFCRGRHNSLLHVNKSFPSQRQLTNQPAIASTKGEPSTSSSVLNTVAPRSQVLIGTALCSILDRNGTPHQIRLAIDSGSQFSFLTTHTASLLGLDILPCDIKILGIGETQFMGLKGRANCQLVSYYEPTQVSTQALVIDSITSDLPGEPLPDDLKAPYLQHALADPEFGNPRPIDFLLGSDLFAEVLTGEIINVTTGQPKLIGTIFGFVVIGRLTDLSEARMVQALCVSAQRKPRDLPALIEDLHHLWDLDEVPTAHTFDPLEVECENYFRETHYRLSSGRYVVRLPFKGLKSPHFPSTRWMAIKRLSQVESRLARNPKLSSLYSEFMLEYEQLGHMEPAQAPGKYIIPHHGVTKIDLDGKHKIRVVFDASAQTANGSLNNHLHIGPKLQNNIVQVTLNFRRHKFCFTVDLKQMFRQFLLHPEDRPYQHILWRKDPSLPVQEFELCTVSYGQACASYLAIRCLHQVAQDHGAEFPLAATAVINDMYVDDMPTGGKTLEEALELQRQVIGLMKKGGFPLSKWASNHPLILEAVATEDRLGYNLPKKIEDPEDRTRMKILGLQWDPTIDSFSYDVCVPELVLTKRAILAAVSRIYDPLGLLGPVVITAKALIQLAWKAGVDWDQLLPVSIQEKWTLFVKQLSSLSEIRIPRCVCPDVSASYELLVFGDASELAYCAVAYLRARCNNEIKMHLLLSKTKLAPIKPTSIPRLELCAALLVARLVETLVDFCSQLLQPPKVRLFTDSTVVLGWLNTPPHLLKTFTANRVVKILESTSVEQWYHVRSADNPADLGSRGLEPNQLISNSLWFQGPSWATRDFEAWPVQSLSKSQLNLEALPEQKRVTCLAASSPTEPYLLQFITRTSSYLRAVRKFAWVTRFITNCKTPINQRNHDALTPREMHNGLLICIKITQQYEFNLGRTINSQTAIKGLTALNPFLDPQGILRVGGRVDLAKVSYSTRHPIILPARAHLTSLIIQHYHRAYCHPGPTLLLSSLRRRYWIVRGRRQVQKQSRACVKCRRSYASPCQPAMAGLPAERLQESRAFANVGVDFAGPFIIRESLRRKAKTSKCYLCLFVCMASKAIHLEAVSALSTQAFLAALDRFVSRRGLPSIIFSDNGTNFVGAANSLRELYQWFHQSAVQEELKDYCCLKEIQWRFIPPHAPHFGGIWEAGVRSAKRLIRSSAGENTFTFEEISTLFTRVEAILNSRPIGPLSDDPSDLDVLTPGHLLIGSPLIAFPEHQLLEIKEGRLDRWQLVQQRAQLFWRRWKAECLHDLQVRTKWRHPQRNLAVNDLVLIQGELSDRCKWPLGRVIQVYSGSDGVVRVAKVSASKGTLKRPATKLIPLLTSDVNESKETDVSDNPQATFPP